VNISYIEFSLLKEYLSGICGIDVPPEKRYLFQTRLSEFMQQEGLRSFSELYNRLTVGEDRKLQAQLVQAMTTHETSFFRDGHPFEVLRDRLLPEIAARRIAEARHLPPRIRILSTGCSSGQEPYSIAMCVHEWLETQNDLDQDNITILGVDISRRILGKASRGVYSDLEVGRYIPDRFKLRNMTKHGNEWQLANDIRRMVSFAEVNLAARFSYIGRFDIIFCRNVIIYFPSELKRSTLSQFHRLLHPGGALIMGASETIYNLSNDFEVTKYGKASYYVPIK